MNRLVSRANNQHWWGITLILLGACVLLTRHIGVPWVGHQDDNGAWISIAIRTYEWHGFFNTNGMVASAMQNAPLNELVWYTHHPPLSVWWSAVLPLLAGFHEAFVRFMTIACTLIGIAALYVLARRLYGARIAWISAGLYAFTPMMAYFGRMPDHEALALALVLMFSVVLVNWIKHPTQQRWIGLACLVVGIVWTAWGGVILLAGICLPILLFYPKQRRGIIALAIVGGIALVLLLAYYSANDPNTLQKLIDVFIHRTSDASGGRSTVTTFTVMEFVERLGGRIILLFTISVTLLTLIGLPLIRRRDALNRSIILGFWIGGIGYLLLFRNAAFIHDYYLIYLAPAIALTATLPLSIYNQRAARTSPNVLVRLRHPLMVALALTIPVSLFAYLGYLYTGVETREPVLIGQAVRQHTTLEDIVTSDIDNRRVPIYFYAEREISFNSYDEINAIQTSEPDKRIFFISCNPENLSSITAQQIISINDVCWMAQLSSN